AGLLADWAAMFWRSRRPEWAAGFLWSSHAAQPPDPTTVPAQRDTWTTSLSQAAAPGAHILIIEDDASSMNALARILKSQGYQVLTALTLHEARRLIDHPRLATVILDLMLPDGDGIEVLRDARA